MKKLLLTLLLATGTLFAHSAPFNAGVRYSAWAIDSRAGDFRANAKPCGFLLSGRQPLGQSHYDYVPGLVAKAVIEAAAYYAQQPWSQPWYQAVEEYANRVYQDAPRTGRSQDDMNATKMYFPLRRLAAGPMRHIADPNTIAHADTAIGRMPACFADLKAHYTIPDTLPAAGGWWHKAGYTNQMWCDGLYMGAALAAELPERNWQEIAQQFRISWSMLWDRDKQLLYHAFTADPDNAASRDWAGVDSLTLHSAAFWGRACGWYILALCDVLELMQNDGQQGTAPYTELCAYLNRLAAGLAARQDAATGCWYQLLDETDAFTADTYKGRHFPTTANYLESSATAIITAALLKGMRLNLLDPAQYDAIARRAYRGFVEQFVEQQPDGTVQLIHNCASAGLGGAQGRDGSKAYYLLGPDVPQRNDYTEGKVLGGFVLAAVEYERRYQAGQPLLFHADLPPLANAGDTLTVIGNSTSKQAITYQWLYAKDNTSKLQPKKGATTPTIIAKKAGIYQLTATAGGQTITTAATQVK